MLMDIEHDDPSPWSTVYCIDDASNYGRGFIGWHTTDYGYTPTDGFTVNGGSGLRCTAAMPSAGSCHRW